MTQDNTPEPSLECRTKRGLRAFAGDRKGVAAIEFALLAIPFFALIFAVLETGIIFMAETALERGVEAVSRDVRTGTLRPDSMGREDFEKAVCTKVSFIMDCSKLHVDLAVYAEFDEVQGSPPAKADGSSDYGGFGYEPTGPDQVVALRVSYDWPLFFDMIRKAYGNPSGNFEMMAMSAFKTESF